MATQDLQNQNFETWVSAQCKAVLCHSLQKTYKSLRFPTSASHNPAGTGLIAVSIRLWSCSQHHDGGLMRVERRGMLNESAQAMNEAEMRLIRSPLLCSALQPRKHQNDLLSLCRSQRTLNFSYSGQWSFVPDFDISQRGPRFVWNVCVKNGYRHTSKDTQS